MKYISKIKKAAWVVLLFFITFSCDEFRDNTPDTEEVSLSPAGSWRIIKATRNGSEITSSMDFSRFRLILNHDGTYSIDNYLPFVVSETSGQWKLNDPYYPFLLYFYQPGEIEKETVANMSYQIYGDRRRIVLSFSPGCQSNTYSYTFEKGTN